MKNIFCKAASSRISFLIISSVLLSGLGSAAAENGEVASYNETASCFLPDYYLPAILFMVLIVFGGLMVLGYRTNKDLDHGEMRRTIAGTLIIGFTALVFLSLHYDFRNTDLVNSYIQLVGVVIGFYFGTRSVMEKRENENSISVENVRFESEDSGRSGRKISVSIRNKGTSSITIDKVYVDENDYNIDLQIQSKKAEKETIVLDNRWEAGKAYKVRAATTTGTTAEDVFMAPTNECN